MEFGESHGWRSFAAAPPGFFAGQRCQRGRSSSCNCSNRVNRWGKYSKSIEGEACYSALQLFLRFNLSREMWTLLIASSRMSSRSLMRRWACWLRQVTTSFQHSGPKKWMLAKWEVREPDLVGSFGKTCRWKLKLKNLRLGSRLTWLLCKKSNNDEPETEAFKKSRKIVERGRGL